MDASLTLEKAKNKAILSEQIKKQQLSLRGQTNPLEVNAIKNRKTYGDRKPINTKPSRLRPNYSKQSANRQCFRCGEDDMHPKEECPAINEKCLRCNRYGHATKMCKTKKINAVTGRDYNSASDTDDGFLVGMVKKKDFPPHGHARWNLIINIEGVATMPDLDLFFIDVEL